MNIYTSIGKIQKEVNNNPKQKDLQINRITPPRLNLDNRDCSLGLDNIGSSFNMNAILQCLAHIKRISEHILNYREMGIFKDKNKFKLSEAFSEVLWEIWFPSDPNKKSFCPHRFKDVLSEINPLFAPLTVNDAKDMLIFILEQLHIELNQSKEENLNLIMPEYMNPMNHQEVLQCFLTEFTKKYKSVISNYFYGSNLSIKFCQGCKISKYSYQYFPKK